MIQVSLISSSWRRNVFAALAIWGCLIQSSCSSQDGGAAEIAWSLRTFSGIIPRNTNLCSDNDITSIRLCWQGENRDAATPLAGGPCIVEQSSLFSCDRENGATNFEIDAGKVAFWLEPVCGDGQPPAIGSFAVPDPVIRDIIAGQIITLQSHLIAVSDPTVETCPTAGCTCDR